MELRGKKHLLRVKWFPQVQVIAAITVLDTETKEEIDRWEWCTTAINWHVFKAIVSDYINEKK